MAQGSHTTLSGYPPICRRCGNPVRISGAATLWFETVAGEKRSWHFACRHARPPPGGPSPDPPDLPMKGTR